MDFTSSTAKRNNQHITKNLHQRGRIIVWTRIYTAPTEFSHEVPYYVALVQLDSGARVSLQLTDVINEPTNQQEVILVARRLGKSSQADIVRYCIKGKPL